MPIILISTGLTLTLFSLWQFDIMFVNQMWGPASSNIEFYQELINVGYYSYASSNVFTINVELFPKGMFTSGFWYDALMVMIVAGWFIGIIGMYVYHPLIVETFNHIRIKFRRAGRALKKFRENYRIHGDVE